jgi:DNA-binding PadR family transcriptional regulator
LTRRRYYQLTNAGRAELRAARERYAAFADALGSER